MNIINVPVDFVFSDYLADYLVMIGAMVPILMLFVGWGIYRSGMRKI